jgi:hypothetical protein
MDLCARKRTNFYGPAGLWAQDAHPASVFVQRVRYFLGDDMEDVQTSSGSFKPIQQFGNGHVQEVVRQAHEELRQLLQQRAEIMKRIGTVKQTISGLANLFGESVLSEELMELVDRKNSGRQPGFTKACRMILMESGRAMNSRDICDYFQEKMPQLLARHKDPTASVTTVLNRLVEYGEAEAVVANGRRAWRWVADQPGTLVPNSEARVARGIA